MIQVGRALVAAALLLTLGGARQACADETSAAAPGTADIVNGIPTHLQPTTGALLFVGPDTKNQFLDCSAVLVGCRTVLTAAHCFCTRSKNFSTCEPRELFDLDVADLRVFFQHTGFHHVREVYVSPEYVRGKRSDIAVLRLSEKVDGVEPSHIFDDKGAGVPHGTPGIITGFGNSGDDHLDAAIKRVGAVETADCHKGIIEPANLCWNYVEPVAKPGDASNVCFKDDGGPLFLDLGNGPVVAGIHSGSALTCDPASFAYDTNVYKNREWIRAVAGDDLNRDECSDRAEVGDNWTVVQGGEGNLVRSEDEARFKFPIPADTELLRVTVNGDTEANGDYDLFIKLDGPPTKTDNDCQSRGVGQFGACQIEEPDASNVQVLVRHVMQGKGRGHSRFQVTATAFLPKPPQGPVPNPPEKLRVKNRAVDLRQLSWKDASKDETGFEVQRRVVSGSGSPFATRASVKANKTRYLDRIVPNTVYTYRVRAFNLFGASEWSNLCYANHPGPLAPRRLRADNVTNRKVVLRWKDRSDDESSFSVERRLLGNKKWTQIAVVDDNDDSTASYTDNSVQSSTSYQYRVRARGRVGECIPNSRPSPTLTVTTTGN